MRLFRRIGRFELLAIAACCLCLGCKDMIAPHVVPEATSSRIVESVVTVAERAVVLPVTSPQGRTVLSLNNAPEVNEPLEQDLVERLVEMFEQRHPEIKIQYSPWQYSPESFVERVKSRTLTDIVEVEVAQMPVIMDMNAAADLTENIAMSDEIRIMNPEVFKVVSTDGRVYGVPQKLHTMALFFNRRLLAEAYAPLPEKPEPEKPAEDKSPAKKSKGADADRFDFLTEDPFAKEPRLLAQWAPPQAGYYYDQRQNENAQRNQYSQRSQQEVDNYYGSGQQYQQQQQQSGTRRRGSGQQQRRSSQQNQYYNQQQQQQQQYYQNYQNQYQNQQQPMLYAPPDEDARQRRLRMRMELEEPSPESAQPDDAMTSPSDVLPKDAETALIDAQTTTPDYVTTVVRTEKLPQDWDQFIRLAVKLTDHQAGRFGYAPALFAAEGGREFCQWGMQAGLKIQTVREELADLDIGTSMSAEVAQFLKDLHWRFDVMPPPQKCYYGNLMRMFAEGKLSMMMMPASGSTIRQLVKLGMPLDDIGIAALPKGPQNRLHITFGKCLIVNSQIDKDKREAAFKWLMFMCDPEVRKLREQYYFRENEQTCEPQVPLYEFAKQQEFNELIKTFRSLPLYADYEERVAHNLATEPPLYASRLYEAISEGVRQVVDREESDTLRSLQLVELSFADKYFRKVSVTDRYVNYLKALVGK